MSKWKIRGNRIAAEDLADNALKDIRKYMIHMHEHQMDTYDIRNKLVEVLEEIEKQPSLGATHPQFSRYFYISKELGTKIREVIDKAKEQ